MDYKSVALIELEYIEKRMMIFVTDFVEKRKSNELDAVSGAFAYSEDILSTIVLSHYLDEDSASIKERVHREMPWVREMIAIRNKYRNWAFDQGSKYDYGAQADLDFISALLIYIAIAPLEDVINIMNKTDYGSYRGHQMVNNVAGVFMRTFRAYLRGDKDSLKSEISSLGNVKIVQDLPQYLRMPRTHWQSLVTNLFMENSCKYEKSFKSANKWYQDSRARHVINTFTIHKIPTTQIEKEKYEKIVELDKKKYLIRTSINPLFLAAIKVAKSFRNYEFQWNENFCPADLIVFG